LQEYAAYYSDHLGSAQLITDYKGDEYERLEYTPYGELWIEKASAASALDVAYRFTGKERDKETGLYYYGARYLDPRDSRWLSVDPALGEYVPEAPVDDEAKKRNGKLPGMGGVFNTVNLHVYHYAGNNPVKLVDPDGREIGYDENTDPRKVEDAINRFSYYQYEFNDKGQLQKTDKINDVGSEQYSEAIDTLISRRETITIGLYDDSNISKDRNDRPGIDTTQQPLTVGSNFKIYVYSNNGVTIDLENGGQLKAPIERKLMHEIAGHAAPFVKQQQGNAVNIENNIMAELFSKKIVYARDNKVVMDAFNTYIKRKDEPYHFSFTR
jgi:RHS repeat-associated protein